MRIKQSVCFPMVKPPSLSLDALCEAAAGIGYPAVELWYRDEDFEMQIMQGDVIRTLRRVIGYVGHIHTAGNPGRNEIDDTQELNYSGICRAIAATAYDGYVGHEFLPVGDPLKALRQAFRTCDQA